MFCDISKKNYNTNNIQNNMGTNKTKTKYDYPKYRILTGIHDANFCIRVSEALELGYELYGSPSLTFNGENVIVGQALIRKSK